MPALDVNSLFARAEQAFLAGRLDSARSDLTAIGRAAGDHPAVLHLLALVEKKSGRVEASREAFDKAAKLAPDDAQIANNYANLLSGLGETEAAIALYGKALAARPDYPDALYNRALALQRTGRLEEALADLDALASGGNAPAKVQSARGSILRSLGRIEEAAGAYDAALSSEPGRLTALHGRARVAMERGEDSASALYRLALEQAPGDLDLVLGLAEAMEAEGDPAAVDFLTGWVERHSDWISGHEALARMRSEAGEPENFADHYRRSLAERPQDRALHYSYWQCLARGHRHAEALAALSEARGAIGDDHMMKLMEAVFTSEAGDPGAALALIDRLNPATAGSSDVQFARGRIALRAGDAAQAGGLFEAVVEADPNSINGWAHLDICWRLLGDQRHQWLSGQPGLYAARDVGLDDKELVRLAEVLRSLHRTRSHPIGQSLRGGTQTRGRLFSRREPEIVRLHEALAAAVAGHLEALPPRDERHPLLRHRGAPFAITGSWSVRLTSRGFHVNHIHPEGILSSACYVSLPPSVGSGESRDGWLELGRPPAELGLPLEPVAVIEPRPGRLALFPSYLFHGTRPFSEGERLTVAFDVVAAG